MRRHPLWEYIALSLYQRRAVPVARRCPAGFSTSVALCTMSRCPLRCAAHYWAVVGCCVSHCRACVRGRLRGQATVRADVERSETRATEAERLQHIAEVRLRR